MIKLFIAIVYMIVMIAIGIYCSKKIKNYEDFTVAGRNIPFWRNVHSISASAIGAGATMGVAGMVFADGISGLWLGIGAALGLLFCGLFLAKKLRDSGKITVPDIMKEQYGQKVADWITVLNLFALIALTAGQVRALGTITQTFIPSLSILQACILMGVVMITYTVLGGLVAASYTDSINMIIMIMAVMVVLPILSITNTGGFEVMIEKLPASYFDPWASGILGIVGILMWIIPTNFVSQENFLRICGAKNSIEAKGATVTASLLIYLPYFLMCAVIGLSGALLFPDVVNSDAILPTMIDRLTNPVVGGLLLAGLLAAVVSTSGSLLLITSVNITDNVIKRIYPNIDENKMVSISRYSVVGVGILSIIIANFASSIVGIMQDVSAPYTSAILPIIVAGFFWKKATSQGAIATIIVSVISSTGWWIAKQPFGVHHIIVSLIFSSLTMFIVSLVTFKEKEVK
ncbi:MULTISPECIES: sodium:solute symporter [Fusobacterium]|uniref:sodium:solute symporter family protein n=1 Tax=Fusobacterium TaxID=848 RepID=UPI0014778273|nr:MULTISPECIES: sodium:solute symporter family protein [Fusobacterium]NME35867.1 sodium:solute symporter family protein [Fusobacterium sp. FSA-380-WT-3A]